MKQLFIFFGLLLITLVVEAQTSTSDVINKLKPTITPQSPHVASLERFGDHPVDLSTGIPSINVPIYDITVGSIKLPISLDYHAAGNRVTDLATWVGLGWALKAGGTISRTVIGRPDEYSTLPLDIPIISLNTGMTNYNYCEEIYDKLYNYDRNVYDTGYDIFSLNIPGRSLKFVLLPDAASGSMATTMPYERIKIEYQKNFGSKIVLFKVTDENGIVYTFDKIESSSGGTEFSDCAWHLSEIQGTRPIDKIKILYTDYSFVTDSDFNETVTVVSDQSGNCSGGVGKMSYTTAQIYSSYATWLPTDIIFPGGKLSFTGTLNYQTSDNSSIPIKILDKIELRGWDIVNNSYKLIKTFDLQQSLFTHGRLRFDGVIMQDGNNSYIGKYQFNYNTEIELPNKSSKNKDYWGYFNGADNSTLIPDNTVTLTVNGMSPYSIPVGGANRSPSESHMQACILKSIIYPTGGTSRFYYEANRYNDLQKGIQLGGGLRMARIETQAAGTDFISVKTYKYGENENTYGQLNQELRSPVWKSTVKDMIPPNCAQTTTIFGSFPKASLNSYEGNLITYREVTEYEGAYVNGNLVFDLNGKTVYRFKNTPDGQQAVPEAPQKNFVISRHWERGLLEDKIVYRKVSNGVYEKVSHLSNFYNELINYLDVEGPVIGMAFVKKLNFTNEWMATSIVTDNQSPEFYTNICVKTVASYSNPVYYKWRKGNMKLVKSIQYTYPTPNSSIAISSSSVQETLYNTNFQPQEQITYESDGSKTHNRIRYATDFSIAANPSSFSKGIALLQSKGMRNTLIEEISYRERDGQLKLTGGKLTLFEEFSIASGWPFMSQIHTLDVMDGCCLLDNLTNTSFSTSSVNKDSHYSRAIIFSTYDTHGNLTKYNFENKAPTQYTWQTTNYSADGLTNINSSLQFETQNSGSTPALTTQYTYQVPVLGVKSVINPTGIATHYDYDAYGRLMSIRNNNGDSVKTFVYHYKPLFTESYPVSIPAIISNRNFEYTLPVNTFSNPNGLAISYVFTGLPAGLFAQGATIKGTPITTGTSVVTVAATLTDGQKAKTTFPLTVMAPQALSAIAPIYGCSTGELTFRSVGGTIGARQYLAIGVTSWTSKATGHTFRPNPGDGLLTIFARNVDAPTTVVTYNWDWKSQCQGVNISPRISSALRSPQSATLNQPFSYTLPSDLFVDPEGQPMDITVTGLPNGVLFNGGSQISGVPSLTGIFRISVKAADVYDMATTAQFTLDVLSSNTVPSALSLIVPTYNCTNGAFMFNTAGGNGAPIEYMSVGITGWTTQRNFIVIPNPDAQNFTLYARQNGVQVSYQWNWANVCMSQNQPPLANSNITIPPQSATVGSAFSMTLPSSYFTDPENQNLTYSAIGLPNGFALNGMVISGVTNTTGVFNIAIKVSDPYSATASRSFSLSVSGSPINQSIFQLLAPTYSCSTGDFTFNTTLGDGTTIEFMAVGITGWTTNPGPFEVLPAPDAQPFTLYARQSGNIVSFIWNWYSECH